MMEMLNAGLLELIVVDDWKAEMWAQILPKIKPRPEIALREAARSAGQSARRAPSFKRRSWTSYKNFVKKQESLSTA